MTKWQVAADVGARFGHRLVRWYEKEARDLPWRHRSDAYSIWVSEILLQQTTVSTVLGRYEAFLQRFPTLEALAVASVDEVVAEVQGLGYYRRFRLMHKAAVQLTQSGRTELPKTSKELQSLPGFGAYTAGAVASIAYGLPEPAVDGNVVRVLTRQFGLQGVCDGAPARRTLAAVIPSLMPNGRASEFNQALFDVGATLCKPKSPLCDACPVSTTCVALKTSSIDQFPAPRKQPSLTAHVVAVARITDGDQVMLRQRSVSETRMPEFWEMPECWAPDETSARAGLIAAVKELGYEVSLAETAAVRVRHSITTHRLDCRLFEASHSARKDPPEWPASTKWMTRAELNGGELPVTTVTRKLISKWLRLSKETVR